jgi:hypothetical protein
MKLAGLNEGEAEPEAAAIEAARPQVQFVSLQLALPSEAALRDMFRSMLVLIPEGLQRTKPLKFLLGGFHLGSQRSDLSCLIH